MPPPKRASSSFSRRSSSSVMSKPPSAQEKQALSNMFKRIESTDSALVKCSKCALMIKSCLMRDHLETKCEKEAASRRRLTEDEIKQELLEIRSQRQQQQQQQSTQAKQRLSQEEELIVLDDDDDDDDDNDSKESQSKNGRDQQNQNDINLECRVEAKKIKTEVITEDQNHGSSSHSVDRNDGDKTSFNQIKSETIDVVVVKQRREDGQEEEEESSDDKLLLEFMEKEHLAESNSPSKLDSDYYLRNFTTAIEWVLNQATFSCLFDQSDYDVIKRFSLLSNKSKMLYVRLFQRKFKWHCADQISYEQIARDLSQHLDELTRASFLIDETSITTYEEIIYLFKMPQLKELARVCNVGSGGANGGSGGGGGGGGGKSNASKTRFDFINLILNHFKSQRMLKFHLKSNHHQSTCATTTPSKKSSTSPSSSSLSSSSSSSSSSSAAAHVGCESPTKRNFMKQCKKLLGKCWKLESESRNVLGRILTLYSLSNTHGSDPNKRESSGQQQLMQIVLINLGKVKYMPYEIKLTQPIFSSRASLLRYHEALDQECELFAYIESKELGDAHAIFAPRVYEFQKLILDPDLNEFDSSLPAYLRVFTAGSVFAKLLSVYAFEVLQKLKLYAEANELFEFLLFKQTNYRLSWRAKWYERLAMNYEIYLKEPAKALHVLKCGLRDTEYVKKAGRLGLSSRLEKMAETKKYAKIEGLKQELEQVYSSEKYEFLQAPTVEIEGTILHSEFIPGRKNVFINDDTIAITTTQTNTETMSTNDEEASTDSMMTPSTTDDQTSTASSTSLLSSSSSATQIGVVASQTQKQSQAPKTTSTNKPGALIKGVEQVALSHYIHKTNWYTHGKHAETATLRTLFGLIFWDIVFDSSVPNVFVDRFQAAPLDLQTDSFYHSRKHVIDSKLDLLQNAPIDFICELVSQTWNLYKGIECSLVSWDLFESLDELLSLVRCFESNQLHALCKYMSQNFRYCRSGGPDLVVWSVRENKVKFVEVKGPGDRLSYKQMVWLDFLIRNGIECEVCHVRGKNSKRLRDNDDE